MKKHSEDSVEKTDKKMTKFQLTEFKTNTVT